MGNSLSHLLGLDAPSVDALIDVAILLNLFAGMQGKSNHRRMALQLLVVMRTRL